MTSIFPIALAYTLAREGGYQFTETPGDMGKGTFAGLTAKTVAAYFGKSLNSFEMQALSPADVAAIYRKVYWEAISGESVAQSVVAMCLFDMAVLMGPVRAVMLAQSVVGVKVDGVIGPKTLAALAKVGVVFFVDGFSATCNSFFEQIVSKNPTQAKFLAGWQKRTAYMDHIAQI